MFVRKAVFVNFSTQELIRLIRSLYPGRERIALHAPCLAEGLEGLLADEIDCIRLGDHHSARRKFERGLQDLTGASGVVALVSGSRALVVALRELGVKPGSLVLTQALTYVATANAILEIGAEPVFLDVDADTLCLSLAAVQQFVNEECVRRESGMIHRATGKPVKACLPVHVLGRCGDVSGLREFCDREGIVLLEDAAQACGSFRKGIHAGLSGHAGILSFNWNKTFTTGGGGAILSQDSGLIERISGKITMCKEEHPWRYNHHSPGGLEVIGPFHAALGVQQLDAKESILKDKQEIHSQYQDFCRGQGVKLLATPVDTSWNHWLQTVELDSETDRDDWLGRLHAQGIEARPLWDLMTELPYLQNSLQDDLSVSRRAWERLVCLPSGLRAACGERHTASVRKA